MLIVCQITLSPELHSLLVVPIMQHLNRTGLCKEQMIQCIVHMPNISHSSLATGQCDVWWMTQWTIICKKDWKVVSKNLNGKPSWSLTCIWKGIRGITYLICWSWWMSGLLCFCSECLVSCLRVLTSLSLSIWHAVYSGVDVWGILTLSVVCEIVPHWELWQVCAASGQTALFIPTDCPKGRSETKRPDRGKLCWLG